MDVEDKRPDRDFVIEEIFSSGHRKVELVNCVKSCSLVIPQSCSRDGRGFIPDLFCLVESQRANHRFASRQYIDAFIIVETWNAKDVYTRYIRMCFSNKDVKWIYD